MDNVAESKLFVNKKKYIYINLFNTILFIAYHAAGRVKIVQVLTLTTMLFTCRFEIQTFEFSCRMLCFFDSSTRRERVIVRLLKYLFDSIL